MSQALVGSEEWQGVKEGLPCWTGTMTAYVKPDEKLGKTIEYVDPETGNRYVFAVPEEHQGKKNVILVAEHPDYTLEIDGKNRVVRAAQVNLVERFPASDGWYTGDAKHDIPQGNVVDSSSDDARHLWRIEKRVGLAARDLNDCNYGRRVVGLGILPSYRLGVVGEEATEGGAPKKLQVESGNGGIVISGVTLDEFRALIGNANASVAELSQMVKPEKLEAMRLLLQAIEIKG